MGRNYYDILQIKPDASAEEIQHAYRKLAQRYHPDHNPGPAASTQMVVINEAYEKVQSNPLKAALRDDLTQSILGAARDVILRNAWFVHRDDGNLTVFEAGRPQVRVVLIARLSSDSLLRIVRLNPDVVAVLAVHLDGPITVGPRMSVVDLMHAKQHGAVIPDGPCKSLLSSFL